MIWSTMTIGEALDTAARAPAMLLQVDPATLGQNLFLIIGALILLALVAFVVLVTWTGIKCLLFLSARRMAQIEHFRQTRRADGKLYPPAIEGVCEVCKRGGRIIYFPQGGVAMCPLCYEVWWRQHDAASPQAVVAKPVRETIVAKGMNAAAEVLVCENKKVVAGQ